MTTVERPRSRAERGAARNPGRRHHRPGGPRLGAAPAPPTAPAAADGVPRPRRAHRRRRGGALARGPGNRPRGRVQDLSASLTSADQGPVAGGAAAPDAPASTRVGETETPDPSATAHADSEDQPSSEPAPAAASQQPVPDAGSGTVGAAEIPGGPVKATGRTVAYGITSRTGCRWLLRTSPPSSTPCSSTTAAGRPRTACGSSRSARRASSRRARRHPGHPGQPQPHREAVRAAQHDGPAGVVLERHTGRPQPDPLDPGRGHLRRRPRLVPRLPGQP